ncbi:MAG: c-type cytochrome [Magnetospirillum gryphiswaldense]|nr:c-type cytochrome [Magnetospirillum gryphiswaldense]
MKAIALTLTFAATLFFPWAASAQEAVKKCMACHTFDKGGAKKIGPNLFGIFGQTSTLPELAGKGVVWDEAALMDYLENPSAFVSAKTAGAAKSKMALLVKDPAERKAAIDYLKTLK